MERLEYGQMSTGDKVKRIDEENLTQRTLERRAFIVAAIIHGTAEYTETVDEQGTHVKIETARTVEFWLNGRLTAYLKK